MAERAERNVGKNWEKFDFDKCVTAIAVKFGLQPHIVRNVLTEVGQDRQLGLYLMKEHTDMVIVKEVLDGIITGSHNLVVLQDRLSAGKITQDAFMEATIGYREIRDGLKRHNKTVAAVCFPYNRPKEAAGSHSKSVPPKTEDSTITTVPNGVEKPVVDAKQNKTKGKGKSSISSEEPGTKDTQEITPAEAVV